MPNVQKIQKMHQQKSRKFDCLKYAKKKQHSGPKSAWLSSKAMCAHYASSKMDLQTLVFAVFLKSKPGPLCLPKIKALFSPVASI